VRSSFSSSELVVELHGDGAMSDGRVQHELKDLCPSYSDAAAAAAT
jgi:hypothetical protein